MKRIAAIVLVFILAFTLISCSNSKGGSTETPSATPSATESATPKQSPDTSASTVGFITDEADHWNRDPYKIASMAISTSTTYNQMINDNFTNWGKVFNYETVIYDAQMDYDAFINQIQVYADQKIDALLCGMDIALVPRVYELTQELQIPVIGMPTGFTDDAGQIIWPSVQQDDNSNSSMGMQWLADNYKNYWKESIDTSKVGLIVLTFSPVSGINDRVPGFENTFKKLFPESAENYFLCDLVTNPNGFSNQSAYEMVASTISSNTGITKWFVAACVDDWAVGAERAVESMEKNADVLIVSDQADAFINEMAASPENSSYVAGCAISTVELTGYCAANLVAILEGRATAETIWPEYVKAGDKYPCVYVKGTMITKDTYKDWLDKNSFETMSSGMKKG